MQKEGGSTFSNPNTPAAAAAAVEVGCHGNGADIINLLLIVGKARLGACWRGRTGHS